MDNTSPGLNSSIPSSNELPGENSPSSFSDSNVDSGHQRQDDNESGNDLTNLSRLRISTDSPGSEHSLTPSSSAAHYESDLDHLAGVDPSELRFIDIPLAMESWISRNGLLPKKTTDGTRWIRMTKNYPGGESVYRRNPRTHSPSGSRIIHRDDEDPVPGKCSTFIHPPLGSELEYRNEDLSESGYHVETTLARLITGSKNCEFCCILLQGIYEFWDDWKPKWNELRWIENQFVQYRHMVDDIPDVFPEAEVEEEVMIVYVAFGKRKKHLHVILYVPPISYAGVSRRERVSELDFYTGEDDPSPWKAFPSSPHIASNFLSDLALNKVRLWIANCRHNHPNCNTSPPSRSPSRLLSISQSPSSPHPLIKLFHTSETQTYTYAAVSHCWHHTRPLKTTAATLSAHQSSVPWTALSSAFRESIELCLRLGYKNIWIDSLCILQNDPPDFAYEAPHMGAIYAGAALVLAAHGPSLFLLRDGTRVLISPPQSPSAEPSTPSSPAVFVRREPKHENFFNPSQDTTSYFGRAWCFQERLFARRILHFGGSYEECYFECNETFHCECGRIETQNVAERTSTWAHLKSQLPTVLNNFDAANGEAEIEKRRNELWETYIALLEDFTAKGLTYSSDIFPASSSLAAAVSPRLGTYHAGLWSHNLILGLQWEALDTRKSRRGKEYIAPSWSWASRGGAVVWYYFTGAIPSMATHNFAGVLEIRAELATADPFGPVCGGTLRLHARVTVMFLADDGEAGEVRQYAPDGRVELCKPELGEGMECFCVLDSVEDVEGAWPGMGVLCVDVMRDREGMRGVKYVSALVLKMAEDRELEGGGEVWRRIGFATMRAEHFEGVGAKWDEVVIM